MYDVAILGGGLAGLAAALNLLKNQKLRVVILEKDPDSTSQYEYRLLATERTSTMDKEITYAEEAGFKLVGICSRGEHMVIMERESK